MFRGSHRLLWGAPRSSLLMSLVAYWKLDEASGTRADSLGVSNLTDNNTVTQNPGKVSNAAQFTAANSESLSIADNTALSTGDIDFTVAAWVYLDTLAVTQILAAKSSNIGAAANNEYALYYASTARFIFRVSTGAVDTLLTANTFGAPALSTWYLVIAWHDSVNNVIGISVNAGTPDTSAYASGVVDSTNAFRLGADTQAGRYLNGRLDEVAVWKRVLTSNERARLYNAGAGVTYPTF